jgi:hypothetical protein
LFRRKRKKKKTKTGKERRGFTGSLSGEVAFAQVKGGRGYRMDADVRPNDIGINLGREYIDGHRPRWSRLAGPVILVWVDTESSGKEAWWTDLNDDASYCAANKSLVLLRKEQRFGEHSKGEIARMWGSLVVDADSPRIRLDRRDVSIGNLREPVKTGARRFYQGWARAPASERTHASLGEIAVSRVGWRHVTRRGRRQERILQSLLLLPAARAMVAQVPKYALLRRSGEETTITGDREVRDYLSLRAVVEFPQRHESLVQVVLLRVRTLGAQGLVRQRIWFYSVYELRRGSHDHPLKGR